MSIDLEALTEADKGRKVIYKAGTEEREEGVISSWNDVNVFVRYGTQVGSQATRPEDLTWTYS